MNKEPKTKSPLVEISEIKELHHAVNRIGLREWTPREKELDRKWPPIYVTGFLLNHVDEQESRITELLQIVNRYEKAITILNKRVELGYRMGSDYPQISAFVQMLGNEINEALAIQIPTGDKGEG